MFFKKQKICFRFKRLVIISVQIKAVTRGSIHFAYWKVPNQSYKELTWTWVDLKSILRTKATAGLIRNHNYFWDKAELDPNISYYNDYTFWAIICIWTQRNNALPILGDWNGVWSGKREAGSPDKGRTLFDGTSSHVLCEGPWTCEDETAFIPDMKQCVSSFQDKPPTPTELTAKISAQHQVMFNAQVRAVAPWFWRPFHWSHHAGRGLSHLVLLPPHPCCIVPIFPSLQGVWIIISLQKGFWVLFLKN